MKRKATAAWQGSLKEGQGSISTESGVLSETQYTFATRFEQGKGTNPEELIAAAHAGCFSMAFSLLLGEAGFTPERIDTTATVTIQWSDKGFAITTVHLDVHASVPGIDQKTFEKAADDAKTGCPVSKVLNAEITLDATLQTQPGNARVSKQTSRETRYDR
jgi:osmotically inducible protein OsmC